MNKQFTLKQKNEKSLGCNINIHFLIFLVKTSIPIDLLTYKNVIGNKTFMNKPTILKEGSIIMDLNKYEAYVPEQEKK